MGFRRLGIGILLACAIGVGIAVAPVAAQDGTTTAERGAEVYGAQKCALCHSIAGKGNPRGVLDDVGIRLTPDELRMWIVDATGMTAKTKAARKPVMRNYKLSNEDLAALLAYLESLKTPKAP
jgi:mono/diheme cytochrome c family protein